MYIKRFISIQGKSDVKIKAKALYDIMKKAVKTGKLDENDPYKVRLEVVYKALHNYIKGNTDSPVISTAELNGLRKMIGYRPLFSKKKRPSKKEVVEDRSTYVYKYNRSNSSNKELGGFEDNIEVEKAVKPIRQNTTSNSGIISSRKLSEMNFTSVGVKGVWLDVLGDVGNPFFAMISGKPGSGKSTFLTIMSKYFSNDLSKRVLFVSHEEGFTRTMQDKFERCNAFHDNTDISDKLPKDISSYDLVIIDSVSTLGMTPNQVHRLIEQSRKTNTSLALVYHATKDGQYKGMSENEHLVDMTIMIEGGVTLVGKNRFGGRGQMNVFEWC